MFIFSWVILMNETKNKFSYLKEGEIILLENIRFFEGENKNEDSFAKVLASLGDIYINDAFSCSHRKQASFIKLQNILMNPTQDLF